MSKDLFRDLDSQFKNCIAYKSTGKNEKLVCEENRKGVSCKVENKDKLLGIILDKNFNGRCKTKIKGCIKTGSKCDLLIAFESENLKNLIFIEIKGEELEKAIKQIISSINYILKKFPKDNYKYRIGAVVIYTGSTPRKQKSKTLKTKLKNYLDKEIKSYNKTGIQDITNYLKS